MVPMWADVQLLKTTLPGPPSDGYVRDGGQSRYEYGSATPLHIAAPAVTTLKDDPEGKPPWMVRFRSLSSVLSPGVPCPSELNSLKLIPSASIDGSYVG